MFEIHEVFEDCFCEYCDSELDFFPEFESGLCIDCMTHVSLLGLADACLSDDLDFFVDFRS